MEPRRRFPEVQMSALKESASGLRSIYETRRREMSTCGKILIFDLVTQKENNQADGFVGS